jgi:hypothetical protein
VLVEILFLQEVVSKLVICKLNRREVVFRGQTELAVFYLEVSDVVVADARSFLVGAVEHVARLGQVNHSQHVWHCEEVVVRKLLVLNQVFEQFVKVVNFLALAVWLLG